MNVRKPILDNPVYSELIILIASMNKDKFTVYDVINDLKDDDFPINQDKNVKSQQVVREQLMYLCEVGFLNLLEEQSEGKNFDKNKKYFSFVWSRLVEEFVSYVINDIENKKNDPTNMALMFDERLQTIKKNHTKIISNYIIKEALKQILYSFNDVYRQKATLRIIFDKILVYEHFKKVKENLLKELKLEDLTYEKYIYDIVIIKLLGKEGSSDLKIFELFTDLIPSSEYKYIFDRFNYLGDSISIASNYLGGKSYSDKRHNELLNEMSKDVDINKLSLL